MPPTRPNTSVVNRGGVNSTAGGGEANNNVTGGTVPQNVPSPFDSVPGSASTAGWSAPRQAGGPQLNVGPGSRLSSIAQAQSLLAQYGVTLSWGNDPNLGPTLMGTGRNGQPMPLWKSSWAAKFAADNGLPRQAIDVLNQAQSLGHEATALGLDPMSATSDSVHNAYATSRGFTDAAAMHAQGASAAQALSAAPRNQFGQAAVGFNAQGQPVYSWSQVVRGAGPAASPAAAAPPSPLPPAPAPGAQPPVPDPFASGGTAAGTPPGPVPPVAPPPGVKTPEPVAPVGAQMAPPQMAPAAAPPKPAAAPAPAPTPASVTPAPPSAKDALTTTAGRPAAPPQPSVGATSIQTATGTQPAAGAPVHTGLAPKPPVQGALGGNATQAGGVPSPFGSPLPPTGQKQQFSPFQYSGKTRY